MNAVDQEFILILILWAVGAIAVIVGLVVGIRKVAQSSRRKREALQQNNPPHEG